MEVNGGPTNSTVTAEMSLSFQEELTATLQNALGVAVEIAVVEITRLLDRALREVQGQIQEALRDNSALKFRLQTAETQLSSVCGGLDQQAQSLEDFPVGNNNSSSGGSQLMTSPPPLSRAQRGGLQVSDLNIRQQTQSGVNSEQNYVVCEPKDANVFQRAPVCGNPLAESTLNFDSLEEATHYRHAANDTKNEQHGTNKTDLSCAGAVSHVLSDPSSLEVAVKVEKEEGYGDPIPVSISVAEEPNSDSLSLAQSRLLEDWRPEQLQSESCQTNMHCQSANHPVDFLLSSGLGQQIHFPKLNNHKRPEHFMFPAGPGPYHCIICGRDFNRKHHLKIHQRIHTGERPYTCSICSARFRHALTLKRHFRLHTGEKPYTCGQCGKKFRNDGGLRAHQCS